MAEMVFKRSFRYWRLIAVGAVFSALAAAALLLLNIKGQYLLLSNGESGETLLCVRADDGDEFSVSFTHSVNKSPVSEHYIIKESSIFLTEMRYRAFGAGMPTEPEAGQTLRLDGEDMVIGGYDREMKYLCYFIGRVAGHTLHIKGVNIPLDSLDEQGQPVEFSIAEYPEIFVLLHIYPKADTD